MVEIEEGAVVVALGGGGEPGGEEGLERDGSLRIDGDLDGEGLAALGRPDAVAAGRHVL